MSAAIIIGLLFYNERMIKLKKYQLLLNIY